jgi:hypothetical protein
MVQDGRIPSMVGSSARRTTSGVLPGEGWDGLVGCPTALFMLSTAGRHRRTWSRRSCGLAARLEPGVALDGVCAILPRALMDSRRSASHFVASTPLQPAARRPRHKSSGHAGTSNMSAGRCKMAANMAQASRCIVTELVEAHAVLQKTAASIAGLSPPAHRCFARLDAGS